MRIVAVDSDGFLIEDWMAVLIAAPTGVRYRQQYGGTACLHGELEGYLVPVFNRSAFTELTTLFEVDLGGAGTTRRFEWTDELLGRLRTAVSQVQMAASEALPGPAEALTLDEGRLSDADEAWLPVLTPDGPGMLIWPNSD